MVQIAKNVDNSSGRPGFRFESDATASFLVVECDAKVLEYQALMLGFNRMRHVLPVDVVIREGKNCYYYNITSKISLSFFLGRRKLGREEFLKLLLDIASVVNESAGFLLTGSNFIFDPDYIYISPETFEPLLVYVPAILEGGSGVSLQTFISDLLMMHINVDGFCDGNLVQRILSEVKSESFNIKSLILAMNDLLYVNCSVSGSANVEKELAREARPLLERTPVQEKKSFQGKKLLQEMKPLQEKKPTQEINALQSNSPSLEGRTLRNGDPLQMGGKKPKIFTVFKVPGFTVLAILVQIIMGTVIFAGRNFLNNVSDNPTATYTAVIMIVLAIDLLLFKKLNAAKLIHIETLNEGTISAIPGDIRVPGDNNAKDHIMQSARTAANRAREMVREKKQEPVQIPNNFASIDSNSNATGNTTGDPKSNVNSNAKSYVNSNTNSNANKCTLNDITNIPGYHILHATSLDLPSETAHKAARKAISCTIEEAAAAVAHEITSQKPESLPSLTVSTTGKTELLDDRRKGIRMLKCIRKQSNDEDIIIDKDDFIIGRLAEHVDHVIKNNAIGKLHAQILHRNKVCLIKDLNSVNGTFVNGNRIESNKEFELKENDRVLLANSEFVYFGG